MVREPIVKCRPQFTSCLISQLWLGQKKGFSPRQFVPHSVYGSQNVVVSKPLFQLLPFFTQSPPKQTGLQHGVSKKSLNPKPTIPPKPMTRKIGVQIDMLRSGKVLGHGKDDQNQENHRNMRSEIEEEPSPLQHNMVQVSMTPPDIQSHEERNHDMPCEMVKLRKASFRLIEEISTEKNSEKLRVLNIMKDDLKERLCRKVKILKEEKEELDNDDVENEKEGLRIVGVLKPIGTISEVDKLEVHMRESGSITNLLLFLRSKLETTETMLQTGNDNVDKEKLEKKQMKLSSQLSEAFKLKEFRDRKGVSIEKMLENYLDIGDFMSYTDYMDTKAKLIKEKREVEDKIQLGEQMVFALRMLN